MLPERALGDCLAGLGAVGPSAGLGPARRAAAIARGGAIFLRIRREEGGACRRQRLRARARAGHVAVGGGVPALLRRGFRAAAGAPAEFARIGGHRRPRRRHRDQCPRGQAGHCRRDQDRLDGPPRVRCQGAAGRREDGHRRAAHRGWRRPLPVPGVRRFRRGGGGRHGARDRQSVRRRPDRDQRHRVRARAHADRQIGCPGFHPDRRGHQSGQFRRRPGRHERPRARHQHGHLHQVGRLARHRLRHTLQPRQADRRQRRGGPQARAALARRQAGTRSRASWPTASSSGGSPARWSPACTTRARRPRPGLQAGDVIVGVDGHEVDDERAVVYRLTMRGIGNRARLDIVRDGRHTSVDVALRAAPQAGQGRRAQPVRARILSTAHAWPICCRASPTSWASRTRRASSCCRCARAPPRRGSDCSRAMSSSRWGRAKIGSVAELEAQLKERQRLWRIVLKRGRSAALQLQMSWSGCKPSAPRRCEMSWDKPECSIGPAG